MPSRPSSETDLSGADSQGASEDSSGAEDAYLKLLHSKLRKALEKHTNTALLTLKPPRESNGELPGFELPHLVMVLIGAKVTPSHHVNHV